MEGTPNLENIEAMDERYRVSEWILPVKNFSGANTLALPAPDINKKYIAAVKIPNPQAKKPLDNIHF